MDLIAVLVGRVVDPRGRSCLFVPGYSGRAAVLACQAIQSSRAEWDYLDGIDSGVAFVIGHRYAQCAGLEVLHEVYGVAKLLSNMLPRELHLLPCTERVHIHFEHLSSEPFSYVLFPWQLLQLSIFMEFQLGIAMRIF